MNITNTSLSIGTNSNISLRFSPSALSYDANTQIVRILFPISNVTASAMSDLLNSPTSSHIAGVLSLDFVGILRDDMKGFYISKYQVICSSASVEELKHCLLSLWTVKG